MMMHDMHLKEGTSTVLQWNISLAQSRTWTQSSDREVAVVPKRYRWKWMNGYATCWRGRTYNLYPSHGYALLGKMALIVRNYWLWEHRLMLSYLLDFADGPISYWLHGLHFLSCKTFETFLLPSATSCWLPKWFLVDFWVLKKMHE